VEPGEDLLETARREVQEEVGVLIPSEARFIPLGSIQQKGGKIVHAWGVESEHDDRQPLQSNLFEMEWPPGSGQRCQFPEVDQARFFSGAEARTRVKRTQLPLIDRLEEALKIKAES
jgi:predicted NUDIX family NTP pyrophosphohydrolase